MVASKKRGKDSRAQTKKEAKAAKKSTKASAKTTKKQKQSGVRDFATGVKVEMKKVHWPTRRETMVYTGVVLSAVVAVSILIWILDSILSKGLSFILG